MEKNSRYKTSDISLISIRTLVEKAMKAAELEKDAAISGVARQVAHDIRSPLSALNLVTSSLSETSEEKRLIIQNATQRINDIANNLLKQSRNSLGKTPQIRILKEKVPTMLVSVVDSLVSEKRIQFRSQMNIQIEVNLNDGYALFAKIDISEISRVLSNLINNSVEALQDKKGKVTINLKHVGNFACIQIIDNGRGIPAEILSSIGKKGFSFGKESSSSGSGLGVSHAIEVLKDLGGRFEIESNVEAGTSVQLFIPISQYPPWFLDKLLIKEHQLVISIDDDRTIHQVWQRRLAEFLLANKISHLSFSSPAGFEMWRSKVNTENINLLILVDFEFIGSHTINGLEFIQKNKLECNSILVTSRFEEASVIKKAQEVGVKIIPKGLSPLIPISLS